MTHLLCSAGAEFERQPPPVVPQLVVFQVDGRHALQEQPLRQQLSGPKQCLQALPAVAPGMIAGSIYTNHLHIRSPFQPQNLHAMKMWKSMGWKMKIHCILCATILCMKPSCIQLEMFIPKVSIEDALTIQCDLLLTGNQKVFLQQIGRVRGET